MRDGQCRAVFKLGSDRLLDQFVRLIVQIGRSFVHEKNVASLKDGSSQAEQLPLPDGQVGAGLLKLRLQTVGKLLDGRLHLNLLQSHPDAVVGVVVEGIEIVAKSSLEDERVLGDDPNFTPQIVKAWGWNNWFGQSDRAA